MIVVFLFFGFDHFIMDLVVFYVRRWEVHEGGRKDCYDTNIECGCILSSPRCCTPRSQTRGGTKLFNSTYTFDILSLSF